MPGCFEANKSECHLQVRSANKRFLGLFATDAGCFTTILSPAKLPGVCGCYCSSCSDEPDGQADELFWLWIEAILTTLRYLEDVKEHIEVFWLPYYSPELNLIGRLWKHLKCSRMANVLFSSFKQFTEHLSEALNDFASHPDFTLSVATQQPRKTIRKKLLVGT
jgi:hypothetical protein